MAGYVSIAFSKVFSSKLFSESKEFCLSYYLCHISGGGGVENKCVLAFPKDISAK